jgi:hypothetical protein
MSNNGNHNPKAARRFHIKHLLQFVAVGAVLYYAHNRLLVPQEPSPAERLTVAKPAPAVEPMPASKATHKDVMMRRRKWLGRALCVLGGSGMAFFLHRMPENSDSVFASVDWAIGTMISTVIAFAGFPGMFAGSIKTHHLKIIDLLWVSASAVAVVFGVVQASQSYAEAERSNINNNVAHARTLAKETAAIAYQQQCVSTLSLTNNQCESLRHIGVSLSVGGYLSTAMVESLCPLPMDPSDPPPGFGKALVDACITSAVIARAPDIPVMKDQTNVDKWRFATSSWPVLMIMLVAFRVMKSIAEVFWRIS